MKIFLAISIAALSLVYSLSALANGIFDLQTLKLAIESNNSEVLTGSRGTNEVREAGNVRESRAKQILLNLALELDHYCGTRQISKHRVLGGPTIGDDLYSLMQSIQDSKDETSKIASIMIDQNYNCAWAKFEAERVFQF